MDDHPNSLLNFLCLILPFPCILFYYFYREHHPIKARYIKHSCIDGFIIYIILILSFAIITLLFYWMFVLNAD
jgi:hypothetical protein